MDISARGPQHLVVIGASWGGLDAIERLLEHLPRDLGAAVVAAQHRLPVPSNLAELVGRRSRWLVQDADDKQPIQPGTVHLAPPGYHLLVDGERLALSTEGPVRYSRPSIDVLFESAADSYGARVVGVLLTGANDDGAAGLARIVHRGGFGIVQDPATAERREMPDAALATGCVVATAKVEEIGPLVARVVRGDRRLRSGSGK